MKSNTLQKTKIYLWLCLSVWSVSAFGQGTTPDIIPPSPEAASLGKYLTIPVSYATGLPQVSIPFFTVQDRDLSLNVGLSYHAGGIRVEEIASRVGLGWNLQASGSISRSVRGLADDQVGGYLLTTNTVEEFRNASSDSGDPQGKYALLTQAINRTTDYEPDIFNFSYPGYSGKFVIKRNGDVMTIPATDHKIEPGWGAEGITRFTITDDNGYKYHFGSYLSFEGRDRNQYSFSYTDGGTGGIPANENGPEAFYSSWHLVAMESPTTDALITFEYGNRNTKSLQRSGQRKAFGAVNCTPEIGGTRTSYHSSTIREAVLTKINFTNGRIVFRYNRDEQRLDLPGDRALVEVRRLGYDNKLMKSFELMQDYFISSDRSQTNSPFVDIPDEHLTHRLQLKGVKEWNNNKTSFKKYDLEYFNSPAMPNRFSFAQDVWGFYNGQNNNASLIPVHFPVSPTPTPPDEAINIITGAERRADPNYAKSLSLKKITYPTGGNTTFDYESNGVKVFEPIYENTYFGLEPVDLVNFNYVPGTGPDFEFDFIAGDDIVGNMLQLDYGVVGCPENDPVDGFVNCGLQISIGHPLTGSEDVAPWSRTLVFESGGYFKIPDEFRNDYRLTIKVINNDGDPIQSAFARLRGFKSSSPYAEAGEFEVGGLRIHRIISDDGKGEQVIKEFSYLNENDEPSGVLSIRPFVFFDNQVYCGQDWRSTMTVQTSTSPWPQNSVGSGHIGYREVREAMISNNEGPGLGFIFPIEEEYSVGYTSYKFDWSDNLLTPPPPLDAPSTGIVLFEMQPNSGAFPYAPWMQRDWARGNLTETEVFKKEEGQLIKLQETKNDYDYSSNAGDRRYEVVEGIKVGQEGHYLAYTYYNTTTGLNRVLKSTITQIENDQELVSSTEYTYGSSYLRPDATRTQADDNQVIITETKYPYQSDEIEGLNDAEKSVLDLMANDDNILALPVFTSTYAEQGDRLLAKQVTSFEGAGGKFLPKSVRMWNRQLNEFEEKVSFDYNTDHNYQNVRQIGGLVTSYLWGYDETLPIAKITNAEYSEVYDALGMENIDLIRNTALTDEEIRNLLDGLRIALPHAQVMVYTYKPGVGTTSSTDFNGRVTKYFYDRFNRLESVKDPNGKLLQSIEYNFRNSQ